MVTTDRTNAERQRRYIARLKKRADGGDKFWTILQQFDARLRRVEEMVNRQRTALVTMSYAVQKLGERNENVIRSSRGARRDAGVVSNSKRNADRDRRV